MVVREEGIRTIGSFVIRGLRKSKASTMMMDRALFGMVDHMRPGMTALEVL